MDFYQQAAMPSQQVHHVAQMMKVDKEMGRHGWGTTEAVDSLLKHLTGLRDTHALVAINIATIIRNAVDPTIVKAQTIVDTVCRTMNNIANEISGICKSKWPDKQHHILYYLVDSGKPIPKEYLRTRSTPTQTMVDAVTALINKRLKSADQVDGNVIAHVRVADQMRVPSYKGLREAISKITQPGVKLNLISHIPLDYHVVLGTGRDGLLFRSHTGDIVKMTPDTLGQIVFKTDDVPFYPCTHVLLGDSHLIKGTVDRKQKAALLEYAKKERWALHTDSYVKSRVREYNLPLSYNLD